MNSELLALIETFDAAKECPPSKVEEGFRLKALYQARLRDFLERYPTLCCLERV